jgi:hypothetical protein
MSAETDFVNALLSYAPLTSLVGDRISKHVVEQTAAMPFVVFTSTYEADRALTGAPLGAQSIFTPESWAQTAVAASAVADQVQAALAAWTVAHPNSIATVLSRASAYDGELDVNGEILTVEWWEL